MLTGGDTIRVLIAGGGVAALEAALTLRDLAGDAVSVQLIAPEDRFSYRPLAVAEPFGLAEARQFPMEELAAAAGATFTAGTLLGVDVTRKRASTTAGARDYDALLVASGAEPYAAVPGAVTFRGPADTDQVARLLAQVEAGELRRVAFVIPPGAVWTLPAYELALLTARHVVAGPGRDVELVVVTPERRPLVLFGHAATDSIEALLDDAVIEVRTGAYADAFLDGVLYLGARETLAADAAIALPRLRGRRILGIPHTVEGFVPVDPQARVVGLRDVYAAGDVTSFPVKQGGIAAQQAEVAATTIALGAGADVEPLVFRPVLRGALLTGGAPRYLRRELTGGYGETSIVASEPLWWPPAKIVARRLAPLLAELAGVEPRSEPPVPVGAVEVEVELEFEP